MAPRETENNAYAKFWRDKQRTLWYVMVFLEWSIFYKFLWNDKGDKIKRKIMINDYSEGGLKMIDIASFNKSLKATWIQ